MYAIRSYYATGESIFVSDPRYQIAYGDQITDLASCRLLADREVLIEDVTMDECYVFAGIRGYEDEQSYYEIDGKLRLAVVRGVITSYSIHYTKLYDGAKTSAQLTLKIKYILRGMTQAIKTGHLPKCRLM